MGCYYFGLTLWTIFESVICTGIIFGWANLLEVLEKERYFVSYCADNVGSNTTHTNTSSSSGSGAETCSEQNNVLRLVYTLSVFMSFTSVFLGGRFMDIFGFRLTRVLAR